MSIFIENDTQIVIPGIEVLIEKAVLAVVQYENVPYKIHVEVEIVDDESIRELNSTYRGIDKETDVLSFPLIDFVNPADYSIIQPNDTHFDHDTNELLLGDIIISIDMAKKQAEDFNHSLDREIGFLVVHSMLHLLGYDHSTNEEERMMFRKQDEILANIGLIR